MLVHRFCEVAQENVETLMGLLRHSEVQTSRQFMLYWWSTFVAQVVWVMAGEFV